MSSLTESDMKLLVLIMQNCKEPIQPDYKTIAENGGYGRVNNVQVAWSRLKKKIEAGASASSTTGTPSGKASGKAIAPKKRGRAEKASAAAATAGQDGEDGRVDDDDDDDDDDDPTPTKYAKKGKTPAQNVKTEEMAEDESVFD